MADKTMMLVGTVTVVLAVLQAAVGQDLSVCNPSSIVASTNKKPTIPSRYSVHTEANINNRQFTTDYHEYFDQPSNRVAVHIMTANYRYTEIYRFKTNELFHIDRDTKICTVTPLSQSNDLYLFGRPTANGNATIFTAAGALHFGGNNTEQYVNRTTVRGIKVDMWKSCLYWPQVQATMNVYWYFSAPGWSTANLKMQVPVRCRVVGTSGINGKKHNFDHTYDFSDFTTTIDDNTVFETPDGVYCPTRKGNLPLPTPQSAFTFTAEVVNTDYNVVAHIEELFDIDLKLARYDSTPLQNGRFGLRPQTEVHDFSTGVAYVIDDVRRNCTPIPIEHGGLDVRNQGNLVTIRTAKQFFYFDKTNYTYEGTRSQRGILCNVWIGQRTDFPKPNSGLTTWQWSFAYGAYTSNVPDQIRFGIPIRLTITGQFGSNYVYNIYNYDERRPPVFSYDIGTCYNYKQKLDFKFLFPGSFINDARANKEQFKYAVLRAISRVGQVGNVQLSALRINNLQVDYSDPTNIVVMFTLLDKAPAIGDIQNPVQEQGLTTVANAITMAVNKKQLWVALMLNGKSVNMTAVPLSIKQTPHTAVKNITIIRKGQQTSASSGTSGGAMAGMGVALLVVFFIIGLAATYLFYRQQGGAFLPKKFDNSDITKDTD